MANYYGTVDGYKTYHLERNNDIPVSDDDEIAAALLVASEWLDGRYTTLFPGLRTGGRDQIRQWPRAGGVDVYGYAIPSNIVPKEVEQATYQIAWRQIANPGSLIVDFTPGKYKSASIDGAVSVEFASFNSASDVQTQFAIVDVILAPLLTGFGGGFASFSGSSSRV